jgi:hypothetical protein
VLAADISLSKIDADTGAALSGETQALDQKRLGDQVRTLVELQHGLRVALPHRYYGKKSTCRVCISLTHFFILLDSILATYVPLLP